jgi:hypothetical protein
VNLDQPSMKIGEEHIIENEEYYIHLIADRFITTLKKYYDSGTTKRMFHPKMHGLVQADFIVERNLPPHLKKGIFSEEKTYSSWIRLSNAKRIPSNDKNKDMRGFAIKIIGVSGEKLLRHQKNAITHDFILVTAQTLQTKTVKDFQKSIYALTGSKIGLFFYAITHPKVIYRSLKQISKCNNLLQERYFSMTPYKFGIGNAVKYAVFPQNTDKTNNINQADPDYLKKQLITDLKKGDVSLDFMVQFQTDPEKMPIENPTIIWVSTFQKVATIKIKQQNFDLPAQNEYGENLSFTPWHCIEDHKPLGGVNRARKVVYEEVAKFRRDRNDLSNQTEPTEILTFN